jgi:hypothetical protein
MDADLQTFLDKQMEIEKRNICIRTEIIERLKECGVYDLIADYEAEDGTPTVRVWWERQLTIEEFMPVKNAGIKFRFYLRDDLETVLRLMDDNVRFVAHGQWTLLREGID